MADGEGWAVVIVAESEKHDRSERQRVMEEEGEELLRLLQWAEDRCSQVQQVAEGEGAAAVFVLYLAAMDCSYLAAVVEADREAAVLDR